MNAKSHTLLLLISIGILVVMFQRPCRGAVQRYRDYQRDIMQQAQRPIETEVTRKVTADILAETRDKIEVPSGRTTAPLRPIKERIDQLLMQKEIKPEEIDTVRKELEQAASNQGPGADRAEYVNLSEKLDTAHKFAVAIDQVQKAQKSVVEELNKNFQALANAGEQTESRFDASLVANIIMLIGIVTRVETVMSAKLDRQLKKLQILEKRAELQKNGVHLD